MADSMKNRTAWYHLTPLLNGATLTVELGMEASGETLLNTQEVRRLSFGLISELACTLNILGSMDCPVAGPPALEDTLVSLPVLAATYTTPYDLPGPLNQTGYLVITRPFLRIQIVETALANHAYTRFWAIAWW